MDTLYEKRTRLIWGSFLLLLIACAPASPTAEIPVTGNDQTPTPTPTSEEEFVLANTAWNLTSYGPADNQMEVIGGTEVTLEFEDETQAVGSAGCNTFGADYSLTMDFEISITNIIQTEIACTDEAIMEQERQYLNALQAANVFEYTSDTLKIWYDDGQNVLNFTRVNGEVTTPTP
jgi:heat shock protein HslJ